MKPQINSHFNQKISKVLTSDNLIYYIAVCVPTIILLINLLFGPIAVEISCSRSDHGTLQCSVVRETMLLTMSPVKIPEPLAVDMIKSDETPYSYQLELRSTRYSYAVPLYSTRNFDVARNISTDINHFLLYSQDSFFSKKYS